MQASEMGSFIDRWLGRLSGVWTVFAPVAPGTVGALVTGVFSTGSVWLSQFGMLGWWAAVVLGGIGVQLLAVLYSMFKSRMSQAAAMKRWSQEVDSINPLEPQFHGRRIKLRDMAHPYTKRIVGKTFHQCELFGPDNIVLMGGGANGVSFNDCEFVIIKDDAIIQNIIVLEGENKGTAPMHVNSISVSQYGNGDPTGSFIVYGNDATINVPMTPDEAREMIAVALDIFSRRQQSIADGIAQMSVPSLPAPAPEPRDDNDELVYDAFEPVGEPPAPSPETLDEDIPF